MEIETAIEVFVRAFTLVRSRTHPYLLDRVEGIWRMHDAPRKRNVRSEGFVAIDIPPERIHEIVSRHATDSYHICVVRRVRESDRAIRSGFRALGYRLITTEPLFVNALASVPEFSSSLPVRRVTTIEEAEALRAAARRRQIPAEHLGVENAPVRQYVAVEDEAPIGWVQSISTLGATWCANLFVKPEYRRRGVARALLSKMLADDRDFGSSASVLLSSRAGALLYPAVGYVRIGELLAYSPGQ
jgi:GNAT superfamily N-acetyltransferase